MRAQVTSEEDEDGRDGPRRNMFIAAVLHAMEGACPVRIRNMSANGALVEAPVLPPAGAEVELVRGRLRAHGRIVWSEGNRCGIRLDAEIAVADWIAPPGNPQQGIVDQTVAEVRSSIAARSATPATPASPIDLAEAARRIGVIAEGLASDPAVALRHGASLQQLDQLRDAIEGLAAR